jgi:predicted alpha/beta superfamily hydrolase
MREMRETLRATFGRVFKLENRRRALRRGTLEHIADFPRQITVYLPPGYERSPLRYPVLYMQDGQNLFEPQRAFVPGQHWRLNEAADDAIADLSVQPMIIVGVDHAGPGRIDEYTPTRDEARQAGGKSDRYGRMLLEEVKPLIDLRYRTIPEDNAVGGSSLGGLVSIDLGLNRPDVFRHVMAMSPSAWWGGRDILRVVDRFTGPRPRIWLDVGGKEGGEALRDVRALHERLLKKGWSDADLHYHEDRRGDHSERAWARRARAALEFLFPPR